MWARNILLLAQRTGWSESAILSLDEDRFAAYVAAHNELIEEETRAAEGS